MALGLIAQHHLHRMSCLCNSKGYFVGVERLLRREVTENDSLVLQTSAHANIVLPSLSLESTVFFISFIFFFTAEDATKMGNAKVLNQN